MPRRTAVATPSYMEQLMTIVREYRHVVSFDLERRIIVVNRQFHDGSFQLYTEIELERTNGEELRDYVKLIAQRLGEDIILDSPAMRASFGI
jgi:hypothetical protein